MVVPFLLAAALTGCATTEPGTATPGGQTPTGTSTSKSAPVNRPKAVDLKTLDPCTLITPETKAALAIRTVEPGSSFAEYGDGSKACGASYEDRKYVYGLYTILSGGVDKLRSGGEQITTSTAAGYPAYQSKDDKACRVYVDAHDGQLLLAAVNPSMGTDSTVDGACGRAKSLADGVAAVLAK
ncbi:hypothetical protein BBK82_15955 [Lentzea guizhouensis]|uniref:DUF3558 domain-containing protein n=1 Tax=Lentzea guizhouensis TaxID=1586287 RepID=A0A1B2HHZ0_9PSEU|nr:hypothetical protein BBK82_15955 [Lentzea guizhouensis]